jgi:hypothetical protein
MMHVSRKKDNNGEVKYSVTTVTKYIKGTLEKKGKGKISVNNTNARTTYAKNNKKRKKTGKVLLRNDKITIPVGSHLLATLFHRKYRAMACSSDIRLYLDNVLAFNMLEGNASTSPNMNTANPRCNSTAKYMSLALVNANSSFVALGLRKYFNRAHLSTQYVRKKLSKAIGTKIGSADEKNNVTNKELRIPANLVVR